MRQLLQNPNLKHTHQYNKHVLMSVLFSSSFRNRVFPPNEESPFASTRQLYLFPPTLLILLLQNQNLQVSHNSDITFYNCSTIISILKHIKYSIILYINRMFILFGIKAICLSPYPRWAHYEIIHHKDKNMSR